MDLRFGMDLCRTKEGQSTSSLPRQGYVIASSQITLLGEGVGSTATRLLRQLRIAFSLATPAMAEQLHPSWTQAPRSAHVCSGKTLVGWVVRSMLEHVPGRPSPNAFLIGTRRPTPVGPSILSPMRSLASSIARSSAAGG